jgi:hypothetical protein
MNAWRDEPSEGYTALSSDAEGDTLRAYALLYDGREWPEHAAVTYLRIMESERRTGRRKASQWPTVRELAEAWNWRTPKGALAKDRADAFLTRTRVVVTREKREITILNWQDAYRHASLEELRGDRAMGANRPGVRRPSDGGPTGSRRGADGEPTAATEQAAQSDSVSDGDQTAARRGADREPTPCASLPRGSTDHRSTDHGETGDSHPAAAGALPPSAPSLVIARPSGPKPSRPKPDRKSPGYSEAIEAFAEEHLAAFRVKYPWIFVGRDGDAPRVKSWLAAAAVVAEDPAPGVERIRMAARAYFAAVDAGTSWPSGDPATTKHFTREMAKWLQTDPGSVRARDAPGARPSTRRDSRSDTLAALFELTQESA